MDYPQLIKDLKEKQWSAVPFNVPRKEFEEITTSFFDFLSIPSEIKKFYSYKFEEGHDVTFVGYLKRSVTEGKDEKEYFHYHPIIEEKHQNLSEHDQIIVENFFSHARNLYAKARESFREVMGLFEEDYPGISNKFFVKDRPERMILRFLKYDARGKGKFLAKAHYDQGSCTLALAESAPGLRIGKDNESLKEVVHKEGCAIFMPGYQFHRVTSSDFKSAWHDVVQSSEDTLNENTARWALVFFADAMNNPPLTEEETHKQESY